MQDQAQAPGSDVIHASRKPVGTAESQAGTATAEAALQDASDDDDEEEEEDWAEHMGEADALQDHADGSAWAVMWLAGQAAVDMETASNAEVAAGISQVCLCEGTLSSTHLSVLTLVCVRAVQPSSFCPGSKQQVLTLMLASFSKMMAWFLLLASHLKMRSSK